MLTVQRLREVLDYNAETGVFTWRVRISNRVKASEVAGTVKDNGYVSITIDGTPYYGHRLAWLSVHGVWPRNEIDHIDTDRSNNRIGNLREATSSQNKQNRRNLGKRNTSGHLGAHWSKSAGRWVAQICVGYKSHHLGCFDTAEEAADAYSIAKRRLHTHGVCDVQRLP